MKQRIKTIFDSIPNCVGVPPGRLGDVLAKITDEARQRILLHEVGYGLNSGYDLWIFSTREEAVTFLRKKEQKPHCKWKLLAR